MKNLAPWEARRPERELLLICLGGVGLGVILVSASLHTAGKPLGLSQFLPFLAYGLCLAGLHLALVLGGSRSDQLLVVTLAFLAGFGLLARARLGAFGDEAADPGGPGDLSALRDLNDPGGLSGPGELGKLDELSSDLTGTGGLDGLFDLGGLSGLAGPGGLGGLAGLAGLTDYAFVVGFALLTLLALGLGGGRYRTLGTGHWVWAWAGLSLLLVLILLVTGQRFRGAVFGVGLLTPTELLKISFVLFSAAYIDREAKALSLWRFHGLLPPWRPLLPLAGVGGALMIMLLIQRDLGMVLLLGVTLPLLLVLGTGRWGYAGYGLVVASLLGWLLLGFFEHGERRIQAWLSPFQDPTGASWQVLQGLSGMYAGGLWGDGFGAGNPEYTPIAESDFIYAVIGEELGFIGTALVLAFFLILILRGLQIAIRARSSFGLLLAAGLTTVLAAQVVLNVGGVTSLLPLTGITLPFISQGGSSLVTAFALLGLLLAISDGEPPRSAGARRDARPRKVSPAKPRAGIGPRHEPRPGPVFESGSGSGRGGFPEPMAGLGPRPKPGPSLGSARNLSSASASGLGTRPDSGQGTAHGRGPGSPTRTGKPRRGP